MSARPGALPQYRVILADGERSERIVSAVSVRAARTLVERMMREGVIPNVGIIDVRPVEAWAS